MNESVQIIKRQRSEYKKFLKRLTEAIVRFDATMDKVMKGPSTYERGQKIARLLNFITLENQAAMHFALKYSFRKIKKITDKTAEKLGECSHCHAPIIITKDKT